MRPVVQSAAAVPFVLHGDGATCRVRSWSGDPSVAQLVLYQQRRTPTPDDVRRWIDDLTARGFRRVRTGALNATQAASLTPHGFQPIQRLALLEHRSPRDAARSTASTDRLDVGAFEAASVVDRSAFATPWALDATAIADVCRATHRHRARSVVDDGRIVAFAISGRDSGLGFLQRLAVDPAHQRAGLGQRLVLDSLRWAARWRCHRVLVNTHVENEAALTLYARTGFVHLDEQLVVLEHPVAGGGVRRAIAALAAAAIGALTVGAAHATAQPSGRAPAGELTLVSQDTVSTTPGNTVTFTVAVPANVDLAALAPDAQVIVTGHEAIERSEPGGELLDTRGRLAAAIAGRLPPVTQETGIPVVNLAQPAAGQLAIPVVVDGDGTSGTPLALGGPGIHPVRLRLESAGQDIGDVLTFVQVTDPATIHAPLAVAVAVGTDADVHLDDQLQVVLDDATVAELTKLADVLEASATPITVHVEPALLAALRASQPALADRFAAVLKKATVMSAPNLPLDVSAAAAADQRPLYTQWLAAGEDLFGTTDLPGTTLRAATAVTTPLSEPGGELLRDLGTRLLLLPPDIYDSLGGSILGYTDTSQLVRVRLSDDRSFDAAIVDRAIGRRLANPSDQPYLDAVYTTVDLLADRQDFITRQLDPARRTVLIGTSDLGLPDPAVLGPLTQLITSTAGLSVSSVSQLGASTDTMVYDGGPLTVDLPATTDASIAERIAVRDDLAARADQTRTMLTADNPLPSYWQSQLDVLPSSAVSEAQVVAIQQQMMGDFADVRGSVEPPRGLDFTMTGRTGTLRLKLRNTADYPVNVRVRLGAASNKLTFPPENVYQLAPNDTTELHFEIKARANGRFPVYLTLLAPGDTATVANPLSITRFTATVYGFSGLGNLVTGAALLILLTWWVHHIRNSRRRKAAEAAMRRHPVGAGMPASSSVPDP